MSKMAVYNYLYFNFEEITATDLILWQLIQVISFVRLLLFCQLTEINSTSYKLLLIILADTVILSS